MKKKKRIVPALIALPFLIIFIWYRSNYGGVFYTDPIVGKAGDYIQTANSGTFKIIFITDKEIGIEKQEGYGPWVIPAVPGEGNMGNYEYLLIDEVNHDTKEFTYRIRRRRPSHPLDF
jgi:hypothetical protein